MPIFVGAETVVLTPFQQD